jgi:hypothetical protein
MVTREHTTQRSEEIRLRRKNKSRVSRSRGKTARRKRQISSRTPPPVMARDSMVGVVMGKQKRARNARRRYDLALNTQGVEMRLPALPRVRIGWRLVSFSLMALMGLLLYQFWNYPNYRVEEAEVHGLQRISSKNVNDVLNIADEPIFTIDHQALEQELKDTFQEFSSVAVAVELPQTVVVTVTERVPVLIWQYEGKTELIDAEGLSFPLRDGTIELRLPVVEADAPPPPVPAAGLSIPSPALRSETDADEMDAVNGEQTDADTGTDTIVSFPVVSKELVDAILTLAEQAPEGAVIKFSEEHGLSWNDPGQFEVYFGDDQDIQMKLTVFDAIYDHLDAVDTRPSVISVEHVHSPYYRLQSEENVR